MDKNPQSVLKYKILLARLSQFWEQLWQASFWPMMTAGIVLLVIFSGVLGAFAHGLRIAFLVLAGLALIYSCRWLIKISWPSKLDGLRRVEDKSHLTHRPVTAWYDELASASGDQPGDEQTKAIWRAHKKQQLEQFSKLKTGLPQSKWMYLDPWAWRVTLALLLLVTFALNGQNWRYELTRLSGNAPVKTVVDVTLDAWISPPAYTRKPPLLLTSAGFKKTLENGGDIIVPEGSKLRVRVNGVSQFSVILSKQLEDGRPGEVLQSVDATAPEVKGQEGADYSQTIIDLKRPVHVAVRYQDKTEAEWKIALIPDIVPEISVTDKLKFTPTGGFAIPWQASDDYGISLLGGTLVLVEKPASSTNGSNRPLQYNPPAFSASLPRLNPKNAKGSAFQDFTAHPWAGQMVSMQMTAKDQAGQIGKSKKITFRLPERYFSKPVARALIEQRRKLFERPGEKFKVVTILAALMAWPDGLIKKSGTYLGLRTVATKLHRSKTDEQIKASVDDLWKLALAIEDGDLSATRRKLEAARKALQKALKEGASAEKIAELTKGLKEALNEFMQSMARQIQEAQRGLSQNQKQQNGLRQNGQEIRARDLQKMMENIENLAKSGANDAAQEMLSQLEQILKNLQPGLAQKPMSPQRTPPAARSLEELTDLMRKQQQLMDQTFKMPDRMSENKPGQQKSGEKKNGKGGDKKQGSNGNEQLATQQEMLKNMLGKLMDQLSKNGLPAPRSLDQAKRAMRDASRALKNGQKGSALGMQGNAMQGLRKGAETMAKDLMQRGQGEEGNFGRHSEGSSDQQDPLGRPMPRNGADHGPNKNMLPKQTEIMRARDIMRALRSRSNDRQRPKIELDYLKRLLDGLF